MLVVSHLETLEIEIKPDVPERLERVVPLVLDELEQRKLPGKIVLTSFDVDALEIVRRFAPDQALGYNGDWDSLEFVDTAKRVGAVHGCVPFLTGSSEIVHAAQVAGLTVSGFPTDTREEFDGHMRRGVDNLLTDAPTMILEFLAQRGE